MSIILFVLNKVHFYFEIRRGCMNPIDRIADVRETSKSIGTLAGGACAALTFTVAFRIIGPLASIACLSKAAYHGLRLNYHWRHSREKNANGNSIQGTELNVLPEGDEKNYLNRDAKFNANDLERLQQEVQRLYNVKAALKSLKWSRGFAISSFEGPFMALYYEMDEGGSVGVSGCQCNDQWHHYTPEEMLEYHINTLKRKISSQK